MTVSRRALLAGLAAASLRPAQASTDAGTSEWVASGRARVRLIDAGPQGGGRLAGLEIALDPGYLTYWRTPGEAGLPPTADFAQSDNLAAAVLRFPAPGRYDEAGAEAFGYKGKVVFPIDVTPRDPGRPVTLVVALSFGVCGALCLPASVTVRLSLTGGSDSANAELVRAAQARVPVATTLGSDGSLAILAVDPGPAADRARVLARAPTDAALFVEAPDPWYIRAGDAQRQPDGRVAFELQVLAGSMEPARAPMVLTLAAGDAAIETAATWDGAAKA